MAPECLNRSAPIPDCSADIFSFGRIMFFIATGVFPLNVMNASEIEDVAKDKHFLLSWPTVSTPLQTDVKRLAQTCMAVDPYIRPTAHDALAELLILSSARSSQEGVGDSDQSDTRHSSLQNFLATYRSAATQSMSAPSITKDAPPRDVVSL